MAPTGAAYHVDWVFSNASNVHVATHRDRFTAFTEFKTELTNGFEVLGIGDVELEVKTHENRKGRKSHRTLILRDVLLVPKCVCNILGAAIQNEYAVQYGSGCGLKDKRTGRSMGLLDRAHFMKLWLVGHSRGTSSLDPDTLYWINAMWSDSERVRWELHKVNISKPMRQSAEPDSPPYVSAEKAWLKRAFGGEFKFLRSYGLSIYRDKDREEGRRIARGLIEIEAFEDNGVADRKYGEDSADMELKAFLANVQANPTSQFAKSMADRVEKFHTVERKEDGNYAEEEEEEGEDEEEPNAFLADLEADPTSHFADRFFSEPELDWIEEHYRHSGNFLLSYGLKFYDDKDCKEGAAIAKSMLTRP